MEYSIIVPCYNSEKTIENLVEMIVLEFKKISIISYEIILINDCSQDRTLDKLRVICGKYNFVKCISLGKNFGQANAIMSGLNYASGEHIINMDDDLQTHPSQLVKLISKHLEGHEIVIAKYPVKKHPWYRNILTWGVDCFDKVCLVRPDDIKFTSFWIINRHIRDEIIKYTNPFPYMEGLFLQVSTDIVNVEVEHYERVEGKSGYNLKKLINLFLNSTNFTIIPLRAATLLGLIFSVIGFIGAIIIISRKLMYSDIVIGWTSLIAINLIFYGVILICIGIVGEYIGRIFMCINKSPQFVVKEKINVEE